jgi:hypothetical protein
MKKLIVLSLVLASVLLLGLSAKASWPFSSSPSKPVVRKYNVTVRVYLERLTQPFSGIVNVTVLNSNQNIPGKETDANGVAIFALEAYKGYRFQSGLMALSETYYASYKIDSLASDRTVNLIMKTDKPSGEDYSKVIMAKAKMVGGRLVLMK